MKTKRFLPMFLSVLLILSVAAAGMTVAGCAQRPAFLDAEVIDRQERGDGVLKFTMTVVDAENKAVVYTLRTNHNNLRDALEEAGIIPDGNKGELVVTVNGITADYAKDGAYWCLYIGEEKAMIGVDDIHPESDSAYTFVYTK